MSAAPSQPSDPRQARLIALQDKLAARDGKPGFERNARVIRGEIARLQQEIGHG